MAADPVVLSNLIKTKVDAKMQAIAGHSPLAQSNPAYFVELCTAIGTGIANGSATILFTTSDVGITGTPSVAGTGTGVGIIVDDVFFKENLYTTMRNFIISDFGSTLHQIYPPSSGNSGKYLLALTEGISESVSEHYATVYTLNSSHPTVYSGTGTISEGNFSGLSSSSIKSLIQAASSNLLGIFWPRIAEAIAQCYVDAIHNHSTGQVTIVGVCIPSISQICGVPGSGSGSGIAS